MIGAAKFKFMCAILLTRLACTIFCNNLSASEKIVFLSERQNSHREFDVMLHDINTQRTSNLTAHLKGVAIRSNSSPKLIRQRNSVVFLSFNPRNLVELNIETLELNIITPIRYEATEYVISQDGQRIVYTEKPDSVLQLFRVELNSGHTLNLSNNSFNNFEPCFSPDGKQIVYVCDKDGSNSIAIMNDDGSEQQILTNPFGDDRYPHVCSENESIVFSSSRGGVNNADYDLYLIDTNGSNFLLFHDSKAFDTKPVFSPDGASVAFISDRRGALFRDIILIEINTKNIHSVTSELRFFNQNVMFNKSGQLILFENTGPSDSDIMLYHIQEQKLDNIIQNPGRDVSPSF
jgi:Tol biopolymer transport system component